MDEKTFDEMIEGTIRAFLKGLFAVHANHPRAPELMAEAVEKVAAAQDRIARDPLETSRAHIAH